MLPSYQHSCVSHGGGICQKHKLYDHVCRAVTTFDAILVQNKLATSRPALVRVAPDPATQDLEAPEASWMIMGCVSRRPIAHCMMPCYRIQDEMQLFVEAGLLKITTMHRAMLTVMQKHVISGGDPGDFAAQVASPQRNALPRSPTHL